MLSRRFLAVGALVLAASLSVPSALIAQGQPSKKAMPSPQNIVGGSNDVANMINGKFKQAGVGNPEALFDPSALDQKEIERKTKGMTEKERDAYADEVVRQKFGISPGGSGGLDKIPVSIGSVSELGIGSKRVRLVFRSEREREVEMLKELRRHAALDAKIARIGELAQARPDAELAARANALYGHERRRHARQKLRIRAATIKASSPAAKEAPQ